MALRKAHEEVGHQPDKPLRRSPQLGALESRHLPCGALIEGLIRPLGLADPRWLTLNPKKVGVHLYRAAGESGQHHIQGYSDADGEGFCDEDVPLLWQR